MRNSDGRVRPASEFMPAMHSFHPDLLEGEHVEPPEELETDIQALIKERNEARASSSADVCSSHQANNRSLS
eukprot:scaffold271740_cov42-Prasinocladus_malaysianus.AAC.1